MEAKAWLVSLACQKQKDLGYSYELWTTALLSKHVREHCEEHGHPSLKNLSRGTVSKILSANQVKPHKIIYYLERRDPDFEQKMASESFFGKMAQSMLRAIRVKSKEELKERICTYIKEINDYPTVYRWKYKMDFG
jgi:uncharacterized membrane protein YbaN (DUF454 family)